MNLSIFDNIIAINVNFVKLELPEGFSIEKVMKMRQE